MDDTTFPKDLAQTDDKLNPVGTIAASKFAQLARQVLVATGKPAFTGRFSNVRLRWHKDQLTLEGTNGCCLARISGPAQLVPGADPLAFNIPVSYFDTVTRLAAGRETIHVKLDPDKQKASFRFDDGTLVISPCATMDLPKFDDVLPKSYTTTLKVPRLELLGALQRVAFVAEQEPQNLSALSIHLQDQRLKLEATNPAVGSADDFVSCTVTGSPEVECAINPSYLIEPLKSLTSDEDIELGFNDSLSPVGILTPNDYTYIAMPMAVPQDRQVA